MGHKEDWLLKSLLGFAFAIPVLFVVVPLLMSSDAAFSGLAEKIVGNLFLTILKIALGFLIAWFIQHSQKEIKIIKKILKQS